MKNTEHIAPVPYKTADTIEQKIDVIKNILLTIVLTHPFVVVVRWLVLTSLYSLYQMIFCLSRALLSFLIILSLISRAV